MAFKGYILGQIQNLSAMEFYQLVRDKEYPPLLDLEAPQWLMDMGMVNIIAANKEKIYEHLTPNFVIELATQDRRDLANVLKTEEGYAWMENFLKLVKFIIETIELNPIERKKEYRRRIEVKKAKEVPPPPLPPLMPPPLPTNQSLPNLSNAPLPSVQQQPPQIISPILKQKGLSSSVEEEEEYDEFTDGFFDF